MKKIIYILIPLLLIGIFVYMKTKTASQKQTGQTSPTKASGYPFPLIDKTKKYRAVIKTTAGDITLILDAEKTPVTVSNFVYLAKKGFYDNTVFHRVIKDFMIQGGDPQGNGTGGPGYRFADEPINGDYKRGTIAMANAGPDTNGSQFFIMHADYPLPKNYVIFGQVESGLETIDKIATAAVKVNPGSGEVSSPVDPVKMLSVRVEEK